MGCSNNTVIGIFIYLHHLFALDCMDIVRRNYVLVTHGRKR